METDARRLITNAGQTTPRACVVIPTGGKHGGTLVRRTIDIYDIQPCIARQCLGCYSGFPDVYCSKSLGGEGIGAVCDVTLGDGYRGRDCL